MMMNIVIESSTLEESKKPTENLACSTCPQGMWFSTPSEISCFCKELKKVIWVSDKRQMITICSGREDALKKENEKRNRELPTPIIRRDKLVEQVKDMLIQNSVH